MASGERGAGPPAWPILNSTGSRAAAGEGGAFRLREGVATLVWAGLGNSSTPFPRRFPDVRRAGPALPPGPPGPPAPAPRFSRTRPAGSPPAPPCEPLAVTRRRPAPVRVRRRVRRSGTDAAGPRLQRRAQGPPDPRSPAPRPPGPAPRPRPGPPRPSPGPGRRLQSRASAAGRGAQPRTRRWPPGVPWGAPPPRRTRRGAALLSRPRGAEAPPSGPGRPRPRRGSGRAPRPGRLCLFYCGRKVSFTVF